MDETPTTPGEPYPQKLRKLPGTAIREQRVLDLWKEHGHNYRSLLEFCHALGPANDFTPKWVTNRRDRYPEFRARLEQITKDRDLTKAEQSRAVALAQIRWPDLEHWKGIWIERLRETFKRSEACALVGKTLDEVEKALETDEKFATAYESVQREFYAQIEDAQVQLAARGKGGAAASAILETQSERFSKMKARAKINGGGEGNGSFDSYDVATVRERARELFQRTLSYIPQPRAHVEVESGS